jgi:Tat protein secretion system quality control protein TatD with DNase activity
LRSPSEPQIAESNVPDEVESCLALARRTQTAAAAGERLVAARAAVELVKAYDRVLENIGVVPLSAPEQQRVRDRLTPVTELLRKYRLR